MHETCKTGLCFLFFCLTKSYRTLKGHIQSMVAIFHFWNFISYFIQFIFSLIIYNNRLKLLNATNGDKKVNCSLFRFIESIQYLCSERKEEKKKKILNKYCLNNCISVFQFNAYRMM